MQLPMEKYVCVSKGLSPPEQELVHYSAISLAFSPRTALTPV